MNVPKDPALVIAETTDGWCLAWANEKGQLQCASNVWPSREDAEKFQDMARPYLGTTVF